MSMATQFSSSLYHHPPPLSRPSFPRRPSLTLGRRHNPRFLRTPTAQNDGAAGATVGGRQVAEKAPEPSPAGASIGSAKAVAAVEDVGRFEDPRWVGGTWDLKQFQKDGKMNWDDVIDAEVRRRKRLEDNPVASSNDNPVVFDTSTIPWWAWMRRFHLPEAELLNGRAAMIGFFAAYVVDSLTGVGLVDQMGNFVCKTLLFLAVAGVLLIRKNEDIETLKKLVEETTFYDKQWQAAWKESPNGFKDE